MAEGEQQKASKDNWNTKPMPEMATTLELNQEFSPEDMKLVRNGLIPEEMEDKWFMYYDESENLLYIHRSWTGYCIYIVHFMEKDDGKFVAAKVEVNRDESQYTCTDDEKDKKNMMSLVGSFLLGRFDWMY